MPNKVEELEQSSRSFLGIPGTRAVAPEPKKVTLNSNRPKVQKNNPLSKKEDQDPMIGGVKRAAADVDQTLDKSQLEMERAALAKQRQDLDFVKNNKGASVQGTEYSNQIPSDLESVAASTAGLRMQKDVEGNEVAAQTNNLNNLLLQKTMQEYLNKQANPYRGVDFESLDRYGQAMFGAEKTGIKNITEPTLEFNNVVGAANRIQDTEQGRQKAALDLMKSFLTPKQTGQYKIENPIIRAGAAGGQTARGLAADEKYVTSAYDKIDAEFQTKDAAVRNVENMLSSGTIYGTDAVLTQMARLAGEVGNIAVQEAGRFKFPTFDGTLNSFIGYLTSNPNLKATPEVVEAMKQFTSVAKSSIQNKKQERYKTLNRNFGETISFRDISQKIYDQNAAYTSPAAQTKKAVPDNIQKILNKAKGIK